MIKLAGSCHSRSQIRWQVRLHRLQRQPQQRVVSIAQTFCIQVGRVVRMLEPVGKRGRQMNREETIYVQEVEMQIRAVVSKPKGYVALITILVVAAVMVGVVVASGVSGVGGAKGALAIKKGVESRVAATGCWEQALLQILNSPSYAGETLGVGNASCVIGVVSNGNDRDISVVSTIVGPPRYVRRVSGVVTRTGQTIQVISYTEQ